MSHQVVLSGEVRCAMPGQVESFRLAPFVLLHATGLLVLVVGWSPVAVTVALFVYFARVIDTAHDKRSAGV